MTEENIVNLLESLIMADAKTNELFKGILDRLDEIERRVNVLYELKRIGEI